MKIAVPREITPGEARVALTPAAAGRLVAAGHQVYVEAGAGGEAFPDRLYKDAKAELVKGAKATYAHAGMLPTVRRPGPGEGAPVPPNGLGRGGRTCAWRAPSRTWWAVSP